MPRSAPPSGQRKSTINNRTFSECSILSEEFIWAATAWGFPISHVKLSFEAIYHPSSSSYPFHSALPYGSRCGPGKKGKIKLLEKVLKSREKPCRSRRSARLLCVEENGADAIDG